ncbi:MAG: SprB repeat-containing protein [Saprospiraceae bacterium]|nr:SprB repeat-containing protein [Candidatus Brachybacter algidus]MBK8748954.1 SprB repeat-containing protein [Candidatus Brachybacter algidus]
MDSISHAPAFDGEMMAFVNGGTPDYHLLWSTGRYDFTHSYPGAGMYTLTVTDALGCAIQDNITLIEPDGLMMDVTFNDPSCGGLNTGSVEMISTSGGATPYQYSISGGASNSNGVFTGLSAGMYTITVQDANGCSSVVNGELTEDHSLSWMPVMMLKSNWVIRHCFQGWWIYLMPWWSGHLQ